MPVFETLTGVAGAIRWSRGKRRICRKTSYSLCQGATSVVTLGRRNGKDSTSDMQGLFSAEEAGLVCGLAPDGFDTGETVPSRHCRGAIATASIRFQTGQSWGVISGVRNPAS